PLALLHKQPSSTRVGSRLSAFGVLSRRSERPRVLLGRSVRALYLVRCPAEPKRPRPLSPHHDRSGRGSPSRESNAMTSSRRGSPVGYVSEAFLPERPGRD